MTCRHCKNLCDCEDDAFRHEASFDPDCSAKYCTGFEPMTNADRIRDMTDEELAEFLNSTEVCDNQPLTKCRTASNGKCIACTLDWLKQPVEVE